MTPPGPPLPPLPSVTPRKQRSAGLVGVVVGVLVFALVAAAFGAWKLAQQSDDTDPVARPTPVITPTPTTPMPTTPVSLARYYHQNLDWHGAGRTLFTRRIVLHTTHCCCMAEFY